MVDKPSSPHPSTPSQGPTQGPEEAKKKTKPFTYHGGQIVAKPMTFLGMHFDKEQAQKLWNILTQNICNAINKDKDRAIKAIRKLRADADENPQD